MKFAKSRIAGYVPPVEMSDVTIAIFGKGNDLFVVVSPPINRSDTNGVVTRSNELLGQLVEWRRDAVGYLASENPKEQLANLGAKTLATLLSRTSGTEDESPQERLLEFVERNEDARITIELSRISSRFSILFPWSILRTKSWKDDPTMDSFWGLRFKLAERRYQPVSMSPKASVPLLVSEQLHVPKALVNTYFSIVDVPTLLQQLPKAGQFYVCNAGDVGGSSDDEWIQIADGQILKKENFSTVAPEDPGGKQYYVSDRPSYGGRPFFLFVNCVDCGIHRYQESNLLGHLCGSPPDKSSFIVPSIDLTIDQASTFADHYFDAVSDGHITAPSALREARKRHVDDNGEPRIEGLFYHFSGDVSTSH
ncbi:hypothetical protein GC197_06655 [bacterium]|nr:hypothetical protein [bacterium]